MDQGIFEPTFSCINSLTILKPIYYSSYLPAYEDGTDSVPKRRHIKFRRRGITQKKTYKMNFVLAFISVFRYQIGDEKSKE
jgi:hypothetical protein